MDIKINSNTTENNEIRLLNFTINVFQLQDQTTTSMLCTASKTCECQLQSIKQDVE